MPGGLINIVSFSNTDLYLTASPQTTFFKSVYRRHTPFSRESVSIPINNFNFNNISEITIPRFGDLVHKIYLEIDIPEILITSEEVNIDKITLKNPKQQLDKIIEQNRIIQEFIKLNIEAYIAGMNDIEAINVVNPKEIIETILEVFKNKNCEHYNEILKLYNFNSNLSNINDKMKQLIKNSQIKNFHSQETERNEQSLYFIKIIKNELISAIEECKIIQKYFNNLLNNLKQEYNDYLSPILKFAWKKNLGHLIIEWIEVYIGTELIDKHYGEWLDILDKSNDEMIGNVESLITFDKNSKPKYKLIIPLQFWFCKLTGLAFPLVSLQHNDLKLRIKTRSFGACCKLDVDSVQEDYDNLMEIIWNNKNLTLTSNLLIEYIYLDNEERKIFAQSAHEYLIETIELNEIKNNDRTEIKCELSFKGPTKEIIWIVQSENPFNYIPIKSAKLAFGDLSLINFNSNEYFNYLMGHKYHSKTPKPGVNYISFALKPEEHQPSGSANLSIVPNLQLYLILHDPGDIKIFTVKYNVLRFLGGYGASAYS